MLTINLRNATPFLYPILWPIVKTGGVFALGVSSYLFALIMDELTAHIQEEVSWFMLFVDDIMLMDESRDGVIAELGRWQEALE